MGKKICIGFRLGVWWRPLQKAQLGSFLPWGHLK
jgi:hypothetical protein